jgi:hypothetical protein
MNGGTIAANISVAGLPSTPMNVYMHWKLLITIAGFACLRYGMRLNIGTD